MDFMDMYRQPSRLYILVLNIATMLASIALFGLGIFVLANESSVLLESRALSWTLVVLGQLIMLVSILGCAGSLGRYKIVLATYGILLSLLVVFQLIIIIYASVRQDKVDNLMDQAWQNAFVNNQRTLQDLEIRLHCCGFSNMTDRAVPSNCHESPAFGFHTSCQKQLRHSFTRHEDMVIAMVTVVEILQLMALVTTMVLWSKLPHDDDIDAQYRTEHSQRLLRGLREDDQQERTYGSVNETH
ncbi:MAG: Tetraspanin family-domain-containing protein [Podila humilis]|nr:MAG: Tetraspanin family-domain-containing protein [Podila humilis]